MLRTLILRNNNDKWQKVIGKLLKDSFLINEPLKFVFSLLNEFVDFSKHKWIVAKFFLFDNTVKKKSRL